MVPDAVGSGATLEDAVGSGATLEGLDAAHPAVAATCDAATNEADDCGDGDQAPVDSASAEGAALASYAAGGGTFQPFLRPLRYTHFFRECAWGDAKAAVAALAAATAPGSDGAWLRRLLERRESSLRKSPLHACCAVPRVPTKSTRERRAI